MARDWLQGKIAALVADYLARHGGSEQARAVVAAEEAEIALYEANRAYVSYGYYIARKAG